MAPLSPYDLRTAAGRGPEGFPAGHRWDSFPEIRFATASLLEERRFEPSVPPRGALLRTNFFQPSRSGNRVDSSRCLELARASP